MSTSAHTPYVIIGAGMHGLSTAWHLARELEARGSGSGRDIVVLDKSGVGAGASGIACGTIRNNYFQPAMRELMAHNVSVWESDPEAFSYHPVGFLQTAPEAMHADVVQIYTEQQAIGYDSVLVEGEQDCLAYMQDMFPDWQATGATTVLHEKQGGYANNKRSLAGLSAKARAAGVRIEAGVTVTGLRLAGGAVTAVETNSGDSGRGVLACDKLIVAAGPWIRDFWAMLELPDHVDVTGPDATVRPGRPMWTYWALQEGTLEVDPGTFTDLRARALPQAVREAAPPVPQGALGGDRGVHPGQLPGLRYLPRERVRDCRLQPWLQDDRRGRARGQGTARTAPGAARAVPVLPLPHRQAASRQPLAVPVELSAGVPASPSGT